MKNRFVRVLVVTVVASIVYITFFNERKIQVQKNEIKEIVVNDTLLNEKGYLVIGRSTNEVKLIDTSERELFVDYYELETFNNDVFISKKKDFDTIEVFRKVALKSDFEDFQVPIYTGVLVDPDFTSNSEAKMFITRIKEACKDGVNFAGYFTLVYWGCGTSCQMGAIINRKTGEIHLKYQSSLGATFRKDSKYIIINSDELDLKAAFVPLWQFKKFILKTWEENQFKERK